MTKGEESLSSNQIIEIHLVIHLDFFSPEDELVKYGNGFLSL